MNGFLTIWTKPGVTIRNLIDERSIGYGLFLILVSSLGSSVFIFADNGFMSDFSLPVILLISIGLIIVIGIPFYFFNAGVYLLLGKMLGGQAKYKQVCLATSSGALPMIGILPVSILALVLYGKGLYAELLDPFAVTNMSGGFYAFYMVVMLGLSIYGLVILSQALGYAHQFSALRGFGIVMIYAAIVFFIVVIVIMIAVFGSFMLLEM